MNRMRAAIREEVELIQPLDGLEYETKLDVLSWIDSGAELCRLEKPAKPPKHLISYFAVVDGEHVLLVDHVNAELWLPTGGHVDPGEHPRDTAMREAREELDVQAIQGEQASHQHDRHEQVGGDPVMGEDPEQVIGGVVAHRTLHRRGGEGAAT